MIIAIPAAVGLSVLAEPICNLLFASHDNELLIKLMVAGSAAVVFFSLSTMTNAILQGTNHMSAPLIHSAIALIPHVLFLVIFQRVMGLGIYSVVYSNVLFALVVCILNQLAIRKYLRYRQEYKKTFLVPIACSAIMGFARLWRLHGDLQPASGGHGVRPSWHYPGIVSGYFGGSSDLWSSAFEIWRLQRQRAKRNAYGDQAFRSSKKTASPLKNRDNLTK